MINEKEERALSHNKVNLPTTKRDRMRKPALATITGRVLTIYSGKTHHQTQNQGGCSGITGTRYQNTSPGGAQNDKGAVREIQRAEVTDTSLQKEKAGGLAYRGLLGHVARCRRRQIHKMKRIQGPETGLCTSRVLISDSGAVDYRGGDARRSAGLGGQPPHLLPELWAKRNHQ